jgi:hypothetical protein
VLQNTLLSFSLAALGLVRAVICNRCATSWYQVCHEFLLETVFKYYHIYCVKFICYIKNLKYLFTPICAFHMYAVRYDVFSHSPFLLIGLQCIGCKLKLLNFSQYDMRVNI